MITPPSLAIRAARDEELGGIAVAVAEQPLMARYGINAPTLERNLRGARERGEELIVAERDGRPAGMAWFLTSGTLALGGYLRLISVFPGAEGQGIGGRLLEAVERSTKNSSRFLFLLVSVHNEAARRFYSSHGYQEGGVLAGLVREGLDEVLMWRKLLP